MKVAYEQIFNGSLQELPIGATYDASKINIGKHTGQYNLGGGQIDKFIGPCPVGVANFGESSLAIPSAFVHPVQITNDLFWIFGSDVATAAATRRTQLWTFVPSTNNYTFVGAITHTFPGSGNVTTRGLRAILTDVTTGTASVSGTAVTGTGTSWLTGISVGSRIGFGSTNPNLITTWYEISAVGSNTSITLTSSGGTIGAGPYVIQDLMIVQANTNATTTNGGIFVTKGLRYETFTNPATTIPAATTTDKIRAVYWLKDAATVTNTVIGGCALGDFTSLTEQYVYSTNGAATTLTLYRYNIRAALSSLSSGAQTLTGTDIVITGNQTVTGNVIQTNNGRVGTLNHGSGSGVASLYLLTTTRVVRVALTGITSGSTTFVSDSMSEVPPGGLNTNVVVSTFTALDISSSLDKLLITGAASTGTLYVTDYYTDGSQMDRRAGCLTLQLPSANRDTDSPIFLHNVSSGVPFIWVEDGWLFWVYTQATTANQNALSIYPLAADYLFENEVNNRIILPKISLGSTPAKLYRVLVNAAQNLGDFTMGVSPDMYRIQIRTSGIDDNSGSWTDVSQDGDLSGLGTPQDIQFSFVFRTLGVVLLPARILSLGLVYETADALPSQYRWNFSDFNTTNGTFAWIQITLFGGSLTTHTIEIYRSDTDALVLTQASTSTTNGTFEYWNGSSWVSGLGTDVVGTRRRFVPSGSLPGSVDLYAKIIVV
jgi:hypothetical protein